MKEENKMDTTINATLNLDSSSLDDAIKELDNAIKKANRLIALLREAQQIIDSLSTSAMN